MELAIGSEVMINEERYKIVHIDFMNNYPYLCVTVNSSEKSSADWFSEKSMKPTAETLNRELLTSLILEFSDSLDNVSKDEYWVTEQEQFDHFANDIVDFLIKKGVTVNA